MPMRRKDLSVTEGEMAHRVRVAVRTRREILGLTVLAAAERARLHPRHWQKIEAGETNLTLATLVRIAFALKVQPVELLGEPPSELN